MKLTLFVNHRCNLACSYCYNGEHFDRPMPIEVARQAVDFGFANAEQQGHLVLSFFGGEPLMELALIERTLEYAAERARADGGKWLYLSMATNGTLLDDRRLALLKKYKFQVQVSLDGNAAAQDATRRFRDGRSSYALVTGNLQRLLAEGFRVRVLSVIDPANVEHLGASFDELMGLGLSYFHHSPNYTAPWDEAACARFEAALRDLGDRYIARLRAGEDVRLDPLQGKVVTHLAQGYKEKNLCQFGQQELAISPTGKIYPCDRLVGEDNRPEICIGDLDHGIDEARRDAMVRAKNQPDPECAACELQPRCMHWCGCANYETTGDVAKVAPIVCWFERCFIAEADRIAEILYAEQNPVFMRRFYAPELPLPKPQD